MINVERKVTSRGVFNAAVTAAMILFTAYGSMQNGWFTLPNLVSWLGLVGTIGIAHGKKWNFPFNMTQNVFNLIVSWRSKLFGDAIMALYYFATQIFGIDIWNKHQDQDGNLITDKRTDWMTVIAAILIGGVLLGGVSYLLGGAFIVLDAVNNSTAIVAQYLQIIKRKRSSWILWGMTNLIGIIIWLGVGVPQMSVMYAVFALNSVRGFINWSE